MKTELCERFGIEYPIFVFTPSEKVAAAVSKAGGLGVLGCVRFNDADDMGRSTLIATAGGVPCQLTARPLWSSARSHATCDAFGVVGAVT